jgi:short-subunit dehydrogenase
MNTRTVVITGASSGIGAALARLLGSQGHRIVVAARREKELNEIAGEFGNNALAVVTDVTRRADMHHLKDAAMDTFGTIDVWINNAGRGITRSVLELTDDEVEQILRVNLVSALYGMQVIIPYFQEQGRGHVVNIASFLGVVPLVPFRSIYSASKAALISLTASLRLELRANYPDVHLSLVMPGAVKNEFAANALHGTPQFPSGRRSPMPAQTSEEVAAIIAGVLDHPQSEVLTNPATVDLVRHYRENVDAFEERLVKGE